MRTARAMSESVTSVAMFVGTFPVLSETFILRQITGLLDLGKTVDIFADDRSESSTPMHPEVQAYQLMERAIFMDMPPEMTPWEIPVWPWHGCTWPPGSAVPVRNWARLFRAVPKLCRCLARAPRVTRQVLSRSEYDYQAASLSALYRLDRLVRLPRQYDVLHAHFGPVGKSFRFARSVFRAPLVVSFHGYDFCAWPRKQGRNVYEKLFAVADALTVNSRYTREQVLNLGGPPNRLHHLPMGVDVDQIAFQERHRAAGEPFRILTVARLVPIKGHSFALRAVQQLRARHPNVQWDIVGDGPERTALEQWVQRNELQGVVRFHGACDRIGLQRWLKQSHVFLLPSITVEGDREGQGLVVQEAQAAGMPVVVTDHGGLPEGVVAGTSGFVVPEGDIKALADRLALLAERPEQWPALGRAGRDYVEKHFDTRRLNRQLLEVYRAARLEYHEPSHD